MVAQIKWTSLFSTFWFLDIQLSSELAYGFQVDFGEVHLALSSPEPPVALPSFQTLSTAALHKAGNCTYLPSLRLRRHLDPEVTLQWAEKFPLPCPGVPPWLVHLLVIFLGLIWVFLFLNWNMVSVSSLCVFWMQPLC